MLALLEVAERRMHPAALQQLLARRLSPAATAPGGSAGAEADRPAMAQAVDARPEIAAPSSSSSAGLQPDSQPVGAGPVVSSCTWQGHAGQAVLCTALSSPGGCSASLAAAAVCASADAAGQICIWQLTSDGGEC